MRLLCALCTHNRLEYTQRCVTSWLATAAKDDRLVVFDNASTDGTREWLETADVDAAILSPRNLFPGAATNRAWHHGLTEFGEFDLLQRSDNDIEYTDGWRNEIELAFTAHPNLGQLGLLNRHEDYDGNPPVTELRKNGYGVNVEWDQVGGNCVIPYRIYADGFRWQPGCWAPGGFDEDSVAAAEIRQNHLVACLIPTVAHNMSFHRYQDYPDYYQRTAGLRGLVPELSV